MSIGIAETKTAIEEIDLWYRIMGSISKSYVVVDTTPADQDVLIGPTPHNLHSTHIISDSGLWLHFSFDDYLYVHLPISRAPANIRFSYAHLGNTFTEILTKIPYQLHDVVKLSNSAYVFTVFSFF